MRFKIYHFLLNYPTILQKEGFLIEGKEGAWGEVAPLSGRSHETLIQVHQQLKALQQGWDGPLFPSVALGLNSLQNFEAPLLDWPVCLLLMGTKEEIEKRAKSAQGYTVAKIKLGDFDLETAAPLAHDLKARFKLRVDFEEKWPPSKVVAFCSHFSPSDFEFIEDPGVDIAPFPLALDKTANHVVPSSAAVVWKPMVHGVPDFGRSLILSSSFESGVGLRQIVALAENRRIPPHALGVGTYAYLAEDLLEEPLCIQQGKISLCSELRIKREKLTPC